MSAQTAREVLAVIGGATALGTRVTEVHAERSGGGRVLCIDRVAPPQSAADVSYLPPPPDTEAAARCLEQHGVRRALYIAPGVGDSGCASGDADSAARDLERWLEAAVAAGVRQVVVAHGAGALGSLAAGEREPRGEGAPLVATGSPDGTREGILAAFARSRPEITVTVCRLCHLAGPQTQGLAAALRTARRIGVGLTSAPLWQFVHVDDAAAAIAALLALCLPGVYHVASDDALSLEEAAAAVRRQVVRYTSGARGLLGAVRWLSRGTFGTILDPLVERQLEQRVWLSNQKIKRDTLCRFRYESAAALASDEHAAGI